MEYKAVFEELLETLIREDGSSRSSAGRFPAVRVNGELVSLMSRQALSQADLEGNVKNNSFC